MKREMKMLGGFAGAMIVIAGIVFAAEYGGTKLMAGGPSMLDCRPTLAAIWERKAIMESRTHPEFNEARGQGVIQAEAICGLPEMKAKWRTPEIQERFRALLDGRTPL